MPTMDSLVYAVQHRNKPAEDVLKEWASGSLDEEAAEYAAQVAADAAERAPKLKRKGGDA